MRVVTLSDKSTHPPLGAISIDRAGVRYQVIDRWRDKVTGKFWVSVATDHGDKPIELCQVVRWEMPTQKLKPGDRVRYIGKKFAVQYGGVPMVFQHWHQNGQGNAVLPDGNITTWLYADELERWEDGEL